MGSRHSGYPRDLPVHGPRFQDVSLPPGLPMVQLQVFVVNVSGGGETEGVETVF